VDADQLLLSEQELQLPPFALRAISAEANAAPEIRKDLRRLVQGKLTIDIQEKLDMPTHIKNLGQEQQPQLTQVD